MLNNRKKFLTIALISSLFISMIPKKSEATIEKSTLVKLGGAVGLVVVAAIIVYKLSQSHDHDNCSGGSCTPRR